MGFIFDGSFTRLLLFSNFFLSKNDLCTESLFFNIGADKASPKTDAIGDSRF